MKVSARCVGLCQEEEEEEEGGGLQEEEEEQVTVLCVISKIKKKKEVLQSFYSSDNGTDSRENQRRGCVQWVFVKNQQSGSFGVEIIILT